VVRINWSSSSDWFSPDGFFSGRSCSGDISPDYYFESADHKHYLSVDPAFAIILKLVFNFSLLLIIAVLLNGALTAAAVLVLVCHLSYTALETGVLFYSVNR
jgi:hypothetical protein